ncbi:MAG: hypothetical protein K5681_00380 [Treponema sp.]|nr:hypothetical protein [Treponema sp.]
MKRFIVFSLIITLSGFFYSCATLQEDVYVDSQENTVIFSSIEDYERHFIQLDANAIIEGGVNAKDANKLVKEIDSYTASVQIAEPAVKARLTALRGLVNLLAAKTAAAQADYQVAKKEQSGDRYVLLLGCRLEKTIEDSLAKVEALLKNDSGNYVLQVEKARLLFRLQRYDQAIAAFDTAFLLLGAGKLSEGQVDYRAVYTPVRDYVWDINSVSGSGNENLEGNLKENLSFDDMISLTRMHSSLLDNISGKAALNSRQKKDLIERLNSEAYFSPAMEMSDEASQAFLSSKFITRQLCARFIWNLYAQNQGDASLLTKYSERYKASGRTKSPVSDISVENPDFNAVLGMVGNAFMELPDGRNFFPEERLSKLDFISILQKVSQAE